MGRTRVRSLRDWTQSSMNWKDTIYIRSFLSPTAPIVQTIKQSGSPGQSVASLRGRQTTSDESHGFAARSLSKRSRFDGDVGGTFSSTSQGVFAEGHQQHAYYHGGSGSNWVDEDLYSPVFAVNPATVAIPTHSVGSLAALGTTAISRCKPTNNVVDLATSIHEIFKEGLPNMIGHAFWKDKTRSAKNAGDEYLNYQFGWVPLANDISGASRAFVNAAKLLEAYQRNSGKIVRRRYEFPLVSSVSTSVVGQQDAAHLATNGQYVKANSQPMPTLYKKTEFYQRTWFSGAFTYHLPANWNSRDWFLRNQAQASYLYGIELTPDTVWNAVPWTWAVDWFSNAGDVVSNLSSWSSDGLVMKWGYVMQHTVTKHTYYMTMPARLHPYGTIWASPVSAFYETKRRERATPFGFSSNWNGLTNRQLAIASALGISRW